jgi:hypothetical protein
VLLQNIARDISDCSQECLRQRENFVTNISRIVLKSRSLAKKIGAEGTVTSAPMYNSVIHTPQNNSGGGPEQMLQFGSVWADQ